MTTSLSNEPPLGTAMLGVVSTSFFLILKQLTSQKGVQLQLMRDGENVDGIVVEQLSGIEYIRVKDKIVESGSYHELVHRGGTFASLVSSTDTRTMASAF